MNQDLRYIYSLSKKQIKLFLLSINRLIEHYMGVFVWKKNNFYFFMIFFGRIGIFFYQKLRINFLFKKFISLNICFFIHTVQKINSWKIKLFINHVLLYLYELQAYQKYMFFFLLKINMKWFWFMVCNLD